MAEQDGDDTPTPSSGAVAGGLVLGLFLAFWYLFVVVVTMIDSGDQELGLSGVLQLAAPAVVGAVLLAVPRTRRAGAGLVIGMAIGLIVLPGVCTVTVWGG